MKLSSWGNYPKVESRVEVLRDIDGVKNYLSMVDEFIPYGNGRSYGDSALAKDILYTKRYNNFLDFDEKNGVLHLQAGALLSEIIEFFLPKGWFLKVTPGTKLITIGGAIASDVHGKNHHKEGCFSECVQEFRLLLPDKKVITVKKGEELFKATCGGMGLTGVILDAKIELKRVNSKYIDQTTIKTKNLKDTFEAFEKYKDFSYSVAWIDCLASDKDIGRSLLMVGEFMDDGDLEYKPKKRISIPFAFPSFALNRFSVKAFNYLYYNRVRENISKQKVDIDSFFYPLDSIDKWNNIYGKAGFTQYQFILPKEKSFEGLSKILSAISKSGKGSFLAVLKLYGEENENYLSFPIEGYSLALDFKIEDGLFELLNELDKIVQQYNGRIYLTKDVRVSKEIFYTGYEDIEKFKKIRNEFGFDKKLNSLQSKRLHI